ncbi:hypothetical protein E2C01_040668 [Portunus trituberculatus]|uniref:Uncharacterized protein n=1 Tax=Portunus trituberculatus TaxID=210409 RepID=A0A5B7FNK9_PORTR|nr:hypothetical protein [Portunus trituberculatus]
MSRIVTWPRSSREVGRTIRATRHPSVPVSFVREGQAAGNLGGAEFMADVVGALRLYIYEGKTWRVKGKR